MSCCCGVVWLFWAYVIYKLLDYLIRIPHVRGRKDRYVFVTGCDTGFGNEISKRLDKQGVNVFSGCLTEKGEDSLRKTCSSRLRTVRLDVTDPISVRKAYDFVKSNLPSGKGLWGVMNNAGIAGKIGPVSWLEIPDYKETVAVNLYGVIDVATTFLPLIKKGKGRVVNTASIFGRTSMLGGAPYTVAKYGVEAFSDGLRRELHDYGASVHVIEPGFHKTNIASPENLSRSIDATWEKLPPEMKEEYGQQYYEEAKNNIIHKFVQKIASDRINDVVDAYEQAMMGMFPRARYVIGKDAKFFWLPVQWLPEWLGDLVLRVASHDRPLPAVLKK